MSQHFIHYLPRRIVMRFPREPNNPWFAEFQRRDDGFMYPKYHTSRRGTGPTRVVKSGDTIWIISQISSPWGVLPPALDARIDVERIEEDDDGKLKFVAATTSAWFPLADISELLATLETQTAKGSVVKVWNKTHQPVGRSLQSMRMLASSDSLQAWSQKLKSESHDFISYRISDGTLCAFMKVRELLGQGKVIFWDRWGLPRRLAERREVVEDTALDDHLMNQLRKSKVVWGIESNKYSVEGCYAAKEKLEAVRLGKYQLVRQ